MAKSTGIEWCDATYNPWRGCEKISEGCANCYAEKNSHRNPAVLGSWGKDTPRSHGASAYTDQPRLWNSSVARGTDLVKRFRVFCGSLMDVWEWRDDLHKPRAQLLQTIASTPYLDWLLLSKRPENWGKCLLAAIPHITSQASLEMVGRWLASSYSYPGIEIADYTNTYGKFAPYVPPNVWVGATVENHKRVDERCGALLRIPARVHFVSAEPLLDLPDLRPFLGADRVNWVIVGGESGSKARPFDTDWARVLCDWCGDNGAAFFMKQLGSNPIGGTPLYVKGDPWEGIPDDIRVRDFPVVG